METSINCCQHVCFAKAHIHLMPSQIFLSASAFFGESITSNTGELKKGLDANKKSVKELADEIDEFLKTRNAP